MNTENSDGGSHPDVSVCCETTEPPSWVDRYKSFVSRVLSQLGYNSWSVSITFADPKTIRELNNQYRKRDYTTDVLSFSQLEGTEVPTIPWLADGSSPDSKNPDTPDGSGISNETSTDIAIEAGDIVISLDTVKENSERFAVDFEEEIRRVTIHGILHLAGHSHETNKTKQEPMLQLQERLVLETQKEKLF